MIDMGIKKPKIDKNDLAMGIVCVTIPMVFALGMIYWPNFPKDGTWIGNLYYVTVSSTLYMLSVIGFIVASTFWWKVGSCIGMSIFGVNLYIELFLDPTNWTEWNLILILVVGLNTLLSVFIIEKLKSKKNGNSNSRN